MIVVPDERNDKMNFYSKSKFMKFKNCNKRLWLEKYKKDEASEQETFLLAEEGTDVGKLAQHLFPGIFVIENKELKLMVEETINVLGHTKYIAEASFFYKNHYCAIDILKNNEDGSYDIYEVKSTSKVKSEHIYDIAYQKFVLENYGLNIKNCFLIHINGEYVFDKVLNIQNFFIIDDVSAKVKKICVEEDIKECDSILNNEKEPQTVLSSVCEQYNGCPFKEYCYKTKKANEKDSVLNLYNCRSRFNWANMGISTFKELLTSNEYKSLTIIQKRQIEHFLNELEDFKDLNMISNFLKTIKFPIYFFDFESYQYLIPKFNGTKPYQQIPFQYSLHILHENGNLEHREFLAEPGDANFLEKITKSYIKDLDTEGSIIAYNTTFECSRIKEAIKIFPAFKNELEAILERFIDLADVFQGGMYYNSKMGKSFSIKSVLPALFPDDSQMDYHELDQVHNGTEAQESFKNLELLYGEEKELLKINMLKYCCLDTFSMVKIYQFLINLKA